MENKDILCCEHCGKNVDQTPIIEKPFRFAFRSDVVQLIQNTGDHRLQENICFDCLQKEINKLKNKCKTRLTITFL